VVRKQYKENQICSSKNCNGNFDFRTEVEMNIFYGNYNDESYYVEGGLKDVIVEPLEEYEK
jgi:hypothetical protein